MSSCLNLSNGQKKGVPPTCLSYILYATLTRDSPTLSSPRLYCTVCRCEGPTMLPTSPSSSPPRVWVSQSILRLVSLDMFCHSIEGSSASRTLSRSWCFCDYTVSVHHLFTRLAVDAPDLCVSRRRGSLVSLMTNSIKGYSGCATRGLEVSIVTKIERLIGL